MTFRCRYTPDIDLADPADVLDMDIRCGKVAGVATIIVRAPHALSGQRCWREAADNLLDTAIARTSGTDNANYTRLKQWLPDVLNSVYTDLLVDFASSAGHDTAAAYFENTRQKDYKWASTVDRAAYKPHSAALVVLPPETMTLGGLPLITVRPEPLPLAVDPQLLQYAILCHELAHVAGGQEAQADRVAALFTRRACGPNPYPRMMADLRAVNVVMHEVLRLNMLPHEVHPYGYAWDTVVAADAVVAMDQNAIDAMSDAQILDEVFVPVEDKQDAMTAFAACFKSFLYLTAPDKDGKPYDGTRHDLDHVTTTARTMKPYLPQWDGSAEIKAVASRFIGATERLRQGTAAYDSPVPRP